MRKNQTRMSVAVGTLLVGLGLGQPLALATIAQPVEPSITLEFDNDTPYMEVVAKLERVKRENPGGEVFIDVTGDSLGTTHLERAPVLDMQRVQQNLDAYHPTTLFNGKNLDGWKIFTSNKLDTSMTWRVADGKIICTGEPRGYIMTEKEYDNFHLTLEWRWPGEPGNSGVLLRTIGEDKIWPSCLEAQLMHNNAGDFWKIGEIEASTDPERSNGRNTRKAVNAEKPLGEWNRYDIFFHGEHVTLVINGQFVNSATGVSQRPGKICLQSEGAPIEFRRIWVTDLD